MNIKRTILYIDFQTAEISLTEVAGIRLFERSIRGWLASGSKHITLLVPENLKKEFHLPKELLKNTEIISLSDIKSVPPSMSGLTLIADANILPDPEMPPFTRDTKDINTEAVRLKAGNTDLPAFILSNIALLKIKIQSQNPAKSLSDLTKNLSCSTLEIPPQYLFYVKEKSDIKKAEQFLTENIRMRAPGWIARNINKKISLPLSLAMAEKHIGPNAITAFNLLLGLSSGFFAAGGTYLSMLTGGLIFQLASIIDGCDGEVAKLLHRSTKFGQVFDTISDNLALLSFVIGMIIGSAKYTGSSWPYAGGAIMLAGVITFIGLMIAYLKKYSHSASLNAFDKEYIQQITREGGKSDPVIAFIKYCKFMTKKDFLSFAYFISALLGILPIWIPVTALGSWIASAALAYVFFFTPFAPDKIKTKPYNPVAAGKNGKKVCVFDFDGTIVDSMNRFADLAGKIIEELYGMPYEQARMRYIETSGLPFCQQIEMIFPNNPKNKTAVERFEKEKLTSYYTESVFEDVPATLQYLKKKGIKTVVSSNNYQDVVEKFVSKAGLPFDMTLGFKENFAKGKDHFKYIMNKWNLSPDEILFIGDSVKDAERAKDSEVAFIGRTGMFKREDFDKAYPGTPAIDSLSALKRFL